MNLRALRLALWAVLVVVAVGGAGLYFAGRLADNGTTAKGADFGSGDYRLETGSGEPFTEASLKGAPTMLFFGYTHCPDVCPTTMADMALWFHELGAGARNLRAVFVSVDPERDTPSVIHDYVKAVSDRITGVTGSVAETGKIEKAWAVYAKKIPLKNGDYSMDHTANIYLLDSSGRFQGTIAYGEDNKTALAKLKNLIARN